jgi:hypothetical protein
MFNTKARPTPFLHIWSVEVEQVLSQNFFEFVYMFRDVIIDYFLSTSIG